MNFLEGNVSLTLFAQLVFEMLHALEGSCASNKLVRELCLIRLFMATVLLVNLLMCILRLVYTSLEVFGDVGQLT